MSAFAWVNINNLWRLASQHLRTIAERDTKMSDALGDIDEALETIIEVASNRLKVVAERLDEREIEVDLAAANKLLEQISGIAGKRQSNQPTEDP